MKRGLALFLAMVLAAVPLGSVIPAKAATEDRKTVDLKNEQGYRSQASEVEDTTYQGVNTLKITPDGTSDKTIWMDNWLLKKYNLSSTEYKYMAVDYYYEVVEQTGGSWTGWRFGNKSVTDMSGSRQETEKLQSSL